MQDDKMPEWDDLQKVWQDSPDVDVAAMVRKARFVWWRMRFNFVFEVAACLFGIGLMVSNLLNGGSAPTKIFSALFILFCVVGIWAAFYIRRGAWGQVSGDARDIVDLQIRRARSSIRYLLVNAWGCLFGAVVIGLAFWSSLDAISAMESRKATVFYGAFGLSALFFVVFPFAIRPFLRRKRQELADLEALKVQLDEGADA